MGTVSDKPAGGEQHFPTSTPLLDLLSAVPQNPLDRLGTGDYFFISSTVILAFLELTLIRSLLDGVAGQSAVAYWVAFLTVPVVALFLSVALHSAGHALVGKAIGIETVGIRIGPFRLRTRGARESLTEQTVFMGRAMLRPRRTDNLRRRLMILAISGPLTSLVVPLVLESAFYIAPAGTGQRYLLAVFTVHVFSALSALYGISSLLPDLDGAGNFSDGARIFMLVRNGARAVRWCAIVRLQSALDSGLPAQEWDEKTIAQALGEDDESQDAVVANWLAYLWAAGRHDLTVATRYLEEALKGSAFCPDSLRDRFFLEAAVFQAWFRHNSSRGEFWAAQIGHPGWLPPLQRRRLEIALRWAGGTPFNAWEMLNSYLSSVRELPQDPVRDLVEREAMEWKAQMESRMLAGAWAMMHSSPQEFEVRSSV